MSIWKELYDIFDKERSRWQKSSADKQALDVGQGYIEKYPPEIGMIILMVRGILFRQKDDFQRRNLERFRNVNRLKEKSHRKRRNAKKEGAQDSFK